MFSVGQGAKYNEKYYIEKYGDTVAVAPTEDIEIKYETVPADKRGDIQ